MNYLHSLLGAIIATYFVSRLTWRTLFFVAAPWRLIATHLLSFALIAALIMVIKSYFSTFPVAQTFVLIGPTSFWLILDVLRGRGKAAPGTQGTRMRGRRDK